MKCDELKVYDLVDIQDYRGKVCLKSEVDEAIAELKQKLHDAEMAKDDAEAANTEYRIDIEKLKAENERLKAEKDGLFWLTLCRDIVTVLGNTPDYFYVAAKAWIEKMCDKEDIDINMELLDSIVKRLYTVKPHEWNEAEKQKIDCDTCQYLLDQKDKELRATRRALYNACANWAHLQVHIMAGWGQGRAERRWQSMETKCRAKAEEYK